MCTKVIFFHSKHMHRVDYNASNENKFSKFFVLTKCFFLKKPINVQKIYYKLIISNDVSYTNYVKNNLFIQKLYHIELSCIIHYFRAQTLQHQMHSPLALFDGTKV